MVVEDIIGTIGVSILLLAFVLNQRGVAAKSSYLYLILNSVGAFLAGLASLLIPFYPFVVLEAVWFLVSIHALYWVYRTKRCR